MGSLRMPYGRSYRLHRESDSQLQVAKLPAEEALPPGGVGRQRVRWCGRWMGRVNVDQDLAGLDQAEDASRHELDVVVGGEVVADLLQLVLLLLQRYDLLAELGLIAGQVVGVQEVGARGQA